MPSANPYSNTDPFVPGAPTGHHMQQFGPQERQQTHSGAPQNIPNDLASGIWASQPQYPSLSQAPSMPFTVPARATTGVSGPENRGALSPRQRRSPQWTYPGMMGGDPLSRPPVPSQTAEITKSSSSRSGISDSERVISRGPGTSAGSAHASHLTQSNSTSSLSPSQPQIIEYGTRPKWSNAEHWERMRNMAYEHTVLQYFPSFDKAELDSIFYIALEDCRADMDNVPSSE